MASIARSNSASSGCLSAMFAIGIHPRSQRIKQMTATTTLLWANLFMAVFNDILLFKIVVIRAHSNFHSFRFGSKRKHLLVGFDIEFQNPTRRSRAQHLADFVQCLMLTAPRPKPE